MEHHSKKQVIAGFIGKDIENYGLLSISDKGKAYLEHPTPFRISRDCEYEETGDDETIVSSPPRGGGGAADEELFGMLKDLRKKVSKKLGLPPFVIFPGPVVGGYGHPIPRHYRGDDRRITGVGAGKAQKFGREFVELIARYVEEHEIERPQDMIVKSVVNKSGNKVFIIQAIDRKMEFEDIADAKRAHY